MILTCSQDRNAYVWTPPDQPGEEWSPQIVLLRFERAATCCAWCPSGTKFIVGGSEKNVMICYYDVKNEFWVAKKIVRHHSAILSLAWHPSGVLMGTAGCDSLGILGAALHTKAGDSATELEVFGAIRDYSLGSILHKEVIPGSWISSISFSPSGFIMALCARNATVRFIKFIGVDDDKTQQALAELKSKKEKKEEGGEKERESRAHPKVMITETYTALLPNLPFTHGLFTDDDTFVGAGFDPQPLEFKLNSSKFEWTISRSLQMVEATPVAGSVMSSAASARLRFKQLDSTGQTSDPTKSASTVKGHTNATTSLKIAKVDATGKPTHLSSTGLDGKVLFWTL